MLSRLSRQPSGTGGPQTETSLRDAVLDFLTLNECPERWAFFRPALRLGGAVRRGPPPDIVLDVGGRVAYVEVRGQGGGPLPDPRARGLALARRRGAACFVVRSLPDMERALAALGVRVRPEGRLTDNAGNADGRSS